MQITRLSPRNFCLCFDEVEAFINLPLNRNLTCSEAEMQLKVSRCQRLPNYDRFLLFLLQCTNPHCLYELSFDCGWSETSISNNFWHMVAAVNDAWDLYLQWPTHQERLALGQMIADFPGCIGVLDARSCEIRTPDRNAHLFIRHDKPYPALLAMIVVSWCLILCNSF